jgi:tRNA(Ile)-lysidine synthase
MIHRSVLIKAVTAITAHSMLQPGDHVIVGVSGGADSVALLCVLLSLRKKWDLTLTAAHLNHMLRGAQARREAEFVRELAGRSSVQCIIEERDVRACKEQSGASLQEAARMVRYRFFCELRERLGAQKVALGHTANDQAETLLLWLLRGTSGAGLSGIPPVRDGVFIRPLIKVPRAEIEAYLAGQQIPYVPDTSAAEPHYVRNRIRHDLMPRLAHDYNPRIVQTLNRLAELVRGDNEILEHIVREIVDPVLASREEHGVSVPVAAVRKYPEPLQGRIIKAVIAGLKGGSQGIYSVHVEAVRRLLEKAGRSRKVQLPAGWSVIREYERLMFTQGKPVLKPYFYRVNGVPARVSIAEIGRDLVLSMENLQGPADKLLTREKNIDFLDYDEIQLPLTVRTWRPGDRFNPLGLGGSKKLKDFFIDNKISPQQRRAIPLLLSGDTIAWVGGLRIDDRYRLKETTRRVLRVTMTGAATY